MAQLTSHPAYLLIEDKLDEIGQRYRILRILRGGLLFLTAAGALCFLAALAALAAGPGIMAKAVLILWAATLVAAAGIWLLRPLLLRPRAVEVARMVERRVPNLHNGLTNSVLLAGAGRSPRQSVAWPDLQRGG